MPIPSPAVGGMPVLQRAHVSLVEPVGLGVAAAGQRRLLAEAPQLVDRILSSL